LLKTGATKLALSNLFDAYHNIIGRHLCDDKNLPTGINLQLLEVYVMLTHIKTSAPAKPAPEEKKELKVERPYVWHNVILRKKAGSDGNAIWP